MTAVRPILLSMALLTLLAGCEKLETMLADPKIAQRIADSKAIGSACRYGLRSIEDCYALNEKASKASVFDGWKEMDQYMRENKIEGVVSKGTKPAMPAEEIIDEKAGDDPAKDSKAKPNRLLKYPLRERNAAPGEFDFLIFFSHSDIAPGCSLLFIVFQVFLGLFWPLMPSVDGFAPRCACA